jgi:hypothetical protein
MKVHLMNSAVMPQPGTYSLEKYEAETWQAELKAAINKEVDFHQYIGYKSTLTFVEHLIGKSLGEVSLKKAVLKDGDMIFVIRLKYRVAPYEKKEDTPDIRDFEFFIGRYWEKTVFTT